MGGSLAQTVYLSEENVFLVGVKPITLDLLLLQPSINILPQPMRLPSVRICQRRHALICRLRDHDGLPRTHPHRLIHCLLVILIEARHRISCPSTLLPLHGVPLLGFGIFL